MAKDDALEVARRWGGRRYHRHLSRGDAAYAARPESYIFENSFHQARLKFIIARAAWSGASTANLASSGCGS